jgi:glycosyltransferase involved in cell wall biosynthesis
MRIALVHDYLNEFGGAERVLLTLSEMYPKAPIYTAFFRPGSAAHRRFKDRKIITSWAHKVPGFSGKLHSPLRFLAPQIWESFDFTGFDLVISSASWYITKGIRVPKGTVHICYCHTPPRYLYGYPTSIEWQKYWLIRQYAKVVNHYLRQYDYLSAQKVDAFVANSQNVQKRIKKFYRQDSTVIYPPVDLPKVRLARRGDYLLVISRIVGGKGLSLAIEAANILNMPLKVVGESAGWSKEQERLTQIAGKTVKFLGHVDDDTLAHLYAGAKAFLALAEDEDFGITPVEAMGAGTPVIAYFGGGYKESVVDGRTGIFFKELSAGSLIKAIKKLDEAGIKEEECIAQANKFSKHRFIKEFNAFVNKIAKTKE